MCQLVKMSGLSVRKVLMGSGKTFKQRSVPSAGLFEVRAMPRIRDLNKLCSANAIPIDTSSRSAMSTSRDGNMCPYVLSVVVMLACPRRCCIALG